MPHPISPLQTEYMILAVRISSNQFSGTSPITHFLFTLHLLNVIFFPFITRKSWRSTLSSRLDNGPLALFRTLVLTDLLLVLFFGRKVGLWKGTIVKNRVSYISTKRWVKSLNESTDRHLSFLLNWPHYLFQISWAIKFPGSVISKYVVKTKRHYKIPNGGSYH